MAKEKLVADVSYSDGMFAGNFYVVYQDGGRQQRNPSSGYLGSTSSPEHVFNLRVHDYDPSKRQSVSRYGNLNEAVAFLEGTKKPLTEMQQSVNQNSDQVNFGDLLYLPVIDNLHWLHGVRPSQRLIDVWDLQTATMFVDRFMTATDWRVKEAVRKNDPLWKNGLLDFEKEQFEAYQAWWREQEMGKHVGMVNLAKRHWANFWDYTVFRGLDDQLFGR